MGLARTYDIGEHDVIVGGYLVTGFADGTAVSVSRDTELYTDTVGLTGEVARSRRYDDRATMEISLMQTAGANQVFSELAQADADTPGGAGVFDVRIVDRGGSTVVEGAYCWISQMPELTLEADATTRTWTFRIADCRMTHGTSPQEGL